MAAITIWSGKVNSPLPGASQVSFTLDPVSGAITQASTSGPVVFVPDSGYASLAGAFSSTWTFPPNAMPADPAAAWAASALKLLLLDPTKTYTMVITEA